MKLCKIKKKKGELWMAKLLFNPKTGDVKEVGWCCGGLARAETARLKRRGYKEVDEANGKWTKGWKTFTYYCEKCKEWHILYQAYGKEGWTANFSYFTSFLRKIGVKSCDEVKLYERYKWDIKRLEVESKEEMDKLIRMGKLADYLTKSMFKKVEVNENEDVSEALKLIETYKRVKRVLAGDVRQMLSRHFKKKEKVKISEIKEYMRNRAIKLW